MADAFLDRPPLPRPLTDARLDRASWAQGYHSQYPDVGGGHDAARHQIEHERVSEPSLVPGPRAQGIIYRSERDREAGPNLSRTGADVDRASITAQPARGRATFLSKQTRAPSDVQHGVAVDLWLPSSSERCLLTGKSPRRPWGRSEWKRRTSALRRLVHRTGIPVAASLHGKRIKSTPPTPEHVVAVVAAGAQTMSMARALRIEEPTSTTLIGHVPSGRALSPQNVEPPGATNDGEHCRPKGHGVPPRSLSTAYPAYAVDRRAWEVSPMQHVRSLRRPDRDPAEPTSNSRSRAPPTSTPVDAYRGAGRPCSRNVL